MRALSLRRIAVYVCGLLVCALALAACNSDPVVLVATPIPPDANYHTYRHPAFSIRLPADWNVRDVSQGGIVRIEFSPPGNTGLPLTVFVLNTGAVLNATSLLAAIDQYQQAFHGDAALYTEVSRTAQGDGSWRVAGILKTPIGIRELNTFFQGEGPLLAVSEADLTDLDAARLNTLQAVVNTLRVNKETDLAASSLQSAAKTDPDTVPGALSFGGIFGWTNRQGDFVINGQVTNQSGGPLEAIRVTAIFYDEQGVALADQQNVVPVDVLPADQTAPFTIRFRDGKPAQAVRYELQAAARSAEYALATYLGDDQFIRGNEIARYNANNYLTVSGDVVNRTQNAAYYVKAIVTVFDDGGRVVATDSAFIPKRILLPGEAARFEATFPELGGSAIRYVVIIEGRTTE